MEERFGLERQISRGRLKKGVPLDIDAGAMSISLISYVENEVSSLKIIPLGVGGRKFRKKGKSGPKCHWLNTIVSS